MNPSTTVIYPGGGSGQAGRRSDKGQKAHRTAVLGNVTTSISQPLTPHWAQETKRHVLQLVPAWTALCQEEGIKANSLWPCVFVTHQPSSSSISSHLIFLISPTKQPKALAGNEGWTSSRWGHRHSEPAPCYSNKCVKPPQKIFLEHAFYSKGCKENTALKQTLLLQNNETLNYFGSNSFHESFLYQKTSTILQSPWKTIYPFLPSEVHSIEVWETCLFAHTQPKLVTNASHRAHHSHGANINTAILLLLRFTVGGFLSTIPLSSYYSVDLFRLNIHPLTQPIFSGRHEAMPNPKSKQYFLKSLNSFLFLSPGHSWGTERGCDSSCLTRASLSTLTQNGNIFHPRQHRM